MSKTKFEQAADNYLFAPDKYLDQDGDIVHGGLVKKTLSRSDTKICALTGIVMAFGLAAANAENLSKKTLILAGGAVLFLSIPAYRRLDQKKDAPKYFFDTDPNNRSINIPQNIMNDLRRKHATGYHVASTILQTGITFPAVYYLFQPLEHAALAQAMFTTTIIAEKSSRWWQAHQVFKGNWIVLPQKPEQEKVSAHLPAPARS